MFTRITLVFSKVALLLFVMASLPITRTARAADCSYEHGPQTVPTRGPGSSSSNTIDAAGRPTLATAQIRPNFRARARNPACEALVRRPGFAAGHLVSASLGGNPTTVNLVPLASAVNIGAYAKFEGAARRCARAGKTISLTIRPIYTDNSRTPAKVAVTMRLAGTLASLSGSFENRSPQVPTTKAAGTRFTAFARRNCSAIVLPPVLTLPGGPGLGWPEVARVAAAGRRASATAVPTAAAVKAVKAAQPAATRATR